jgi:hypothetical protein
MLKTNKTVIALLIAFAANTFCIAGTGKDGKTTMPNAADPIYVKGKPTYSSEDDGFGGCRTTLTCEGSEGTCAVISPCPPPVALAVSTNDYSAVSNDLFVTSGSGFEFEIPGNPTTIGKSFTVVKSNSGIVVWTIFSNLPY